MLDAMMKRNEIEHAKDRKFVEGRKKMSFNDMLIDPPWDKKNMEKFGRTNCGLQIYHDTFLPLLEGTPAKDYYYNESKYQKSLEELINTKLSHLVYKREQK